MSTVELAVAEPARGVEIGRAHARPAPVRYRGLCVQHRAVPLEDAYAGLQQRAIAGLRQRSEQWNVGSVRHEHPDVHAVSSGRPERLHIGGGARIVGVGQPEALAGDRCDELTQTEQAGRVGNRRDDAQGDFSGWRFRIYDRRAVVGQRLTHQRPHLRERLLDLPHRRPTHLHAGIAPRRNIARGVADPGLSDAEAADKSHRAVHGQHLSMIAAEPTQGAGRSRRVVAADLDAPRRAVASRT